MEANQLRLAVEIYHLFTMGFIHPNGGWEWDFCNINSIYSRNPLGNYTVIKERITHEKKR